MAGLCNRSQWYSRAAALLLVAFYLTHDDSTCLHSPGILSLRRGPASVLSIRAYARVSYRCTRNVPRTVRATVAARRSLVHVHASRTYDHHGHGRPRRAVKASQSSFHCCSLHRRVGNTRRFERKSNPRKGQRTARTRPDTHNADAYTHVHTYIHTYI